MATIRVNFNKKVKMHEACANDELRPVMACIYFKDGYAYASNGHILVKNKVSEISSIPEDQIEQLNDVYLHKDIYKKILEFDEIDISADGIECRKESKKAFFYFQTFEDSKYPNADKVLEDMLNQPTATIPKCGFNVKYLSRLHNAIPDSDNFYFRFKGSYPAVSAVLESTNTDISSVGIIMGLDISEEGQ